MVRHGAVSCHNTAQSATPTGLHFGRLGRRFTSVRGPALERRARATARATVPASTRCGLPHALKFLLMLRGGARQTKSQGTAVCARHRERVAVSPWRGPLAVADRYYRDSITRVWDAVPCR
ncbi:hypothetical protein CKW46_01750 [Mycobacterium liflandii]|nr:hypothetical protein CKW46_01750 [Mycobacterium liflandii]